MGSNHERDAELGRLWSAKAGYQGQRRHIMSKRLGKDASQGSFFTSLLDLRELVVGLPVRLNKIMDAPIIMEGC